MSNETKTRIIRGEAHGINGQYEARWFDEGRTGRDTVIIHIEYTDEPLGREPWPINRVNDESGGESV